MHGKTCAVRHDGTGLFEGLPSPLTAARYHCLTVAPGEPPDCLAVNARSAEDGTRPGPSPPDAADPRRAIPSGERRERAGHGLLANFLAWPA